MIQIDLISLTKVLITMNELKLPFNARLTFTLFSIILVIYIAHTGSGIIVPMTFATLIAIMLLPVVSRLEKWKLPRGIAAFLAVLLFIIGISLVALLLGRQMAAFISDFPQLEQKLLAFLSSTQEWVNLNFHVDSSTQLSYIEKALMGTLGTATSFISQTFVSVSSLLIFIVFMFLYAFFILYYRRLLVAFLVAIFKEKHREKLLNVIASTRSVIKSYLGGLVIEMVIVAVLNTVTFLILGIKYAILLGVMSAIFNIIPYVGILTAAILSILVTLATGAPIQALQAGITLFLVHLLDSNILFPSIVGSKVRINALVTIIGVVLGNMLWGIPGMFLAIPIIAIIKIICVNIPEVQPWALLLGDEDSHHRVYSKKEVVAAPPPPPIDENQEKKI
ncbi:Predicted PurR-regulated permease PerM [Chitinophaga terrae (ex Kim and Jung 2007)]|uniref:Predicted PurR-regulated permease PerM n=2 Tax=Chitinophaga terrae (ex Kim and Jung 2007) TaxID=408074 RepID=A0A1H4ENP1_9BACT|nr:Predicted PurR-regulated permease PerM [Chitinophaga terrae (ex Kim and Jung 2007)]